MSRGPSLPITRGGEGYTCPHYVPAEGAKRCRSYLGNGACERPDQFMCVEWLKVNGQQDNPVAQVLDLFGAPAPELDGRKSAPAEATQPASPAPRTPTPGRDLPLVRNLSDTEIASFRALGAELCVESETCGPIWLVSEYTGDPARKELRIDHAATLATVCAVFPGARVAAFEKRPQANSEHDK